jgi:transcriptional regulator GlxA family with amidase domain
MTRRNLASRLSVEDLAEVPHLSQRQFSRGVYQKPYPC